MHYPDQKAAASVLIMLLCHMRGVNVRLRTIVTLSHTVSGHAREETCLKFEQSGIVQTPVLYFVLALCARLNRRPINRIRPTAIYKLCKKTFKRIAKATPQT